MRKTWRPFLSISLLLVLTTFFLPVEASTLKNRLEKFRTTKPAKPVHLLASNTQEVSFTLQTPWEQILLEQKAADGAVYTQLAIQDWPTTQQPGEPALPFYTQAIGIPFGAHLSITAAPGQTRVIPLPHPLIPAATHTLSDASFDPLSGENSLPGLTTSFQPLAEVYQSQTAYPGVFASLLEEAVIRQQRVASIAVYPIQYRPDAQEVIVYETIEINIAFQGKIPTGPSAAPQEAAPFETLLSQQLLNYDSASQWRQPTSQDPSQNLALAQTQNQAWSPPNPGWRIYVREEGFYKLTYAELAAAGLPVDTLDPRQFQIFSSGSEIAIQVAGEEDGVFDSADYLLFYGQAIDNKYSLDNVYWLTYGQQNGLRMSPRSGAPDGSAQTPDPFQTIRRFEQNKYYLALAPGDENLERFFWQFINPTGFQPKDWSYSFSLPALSPGDVKLTVSIFGNSRSIIYPDHHVKIYLNNSLVEDVVISTGSF